MFNFYLFEYEKAIKYFVLRSLLKLFIDNSYVSTRKIIFFDSFQYIILEHFVYVLYSTICISIPLLYRKKYFFNSLTS